MPAPGCFPRHYRRDPQRPGVLTLPAARAGRVKVRIAMTLRDGRKVADVRRFRTCVKRAR